MKELLKVSQNRIGDDKVNSVSARELHIVLEVKKDFSDWIKVQIKRAMLEENIDYIKVWSDTQKGIYFLRETELLQKFKTVQQATASGWQSDYTLTLDSCLIINQKISFNPNTVKVAKSISKFIKEKIIIKEQNREEVVFFKELELTLKAMNIEIETQFKVLNYRLDGYIPQYNLAIEFDEKHHKITSNKKKDKNREEDIIKELQCNFLRLSSDEHNNFNIGLVIKEIFNYKEENFSKRQNKILEDLKNRKLSTKELSEKLGFSKSTILKDLKILLTNDKIEKIKSGRNVYYKIKL
jgi:phage anti-repressor protein/very-short-patch-repair endonuclease